MDTHFWSTQRVCVGSICCVGLACQLHNACCTHHAHTQFTRTMHTHAQTAIENSMNYDKCLKLSGDARASCQLDKAMANVSGTHNRLCALSVITGSLQAHREANCFLFCKHALLFIFQPPLRTLCTISIHTHGNVTHTTGWQHAGGSGGGPRGD